MINVCLSALKYIQMYEEHSMKHWCQHFYPTAPSRLSAGHTFALPLKTCRLHPGLHGHPLCPEFFQVPRDYFKRQKSSTILTYKRTGKKTEY